jgi:hypothetical protein
MPGYSTTPLYKKLGIKPDTRINLIHPPKDYLHWLEPISHSINLVDQPPFDFVHLFTNSIGELESQLLNLKSEIHQNGMIWISWYKKASGFPSEINESIIRDIAISLGLVDIKVCAVNETWSGLKLVIRKNLR